jgi:SlyX protein
LAHHIKVNDELSDIVADQSKRIEALERRVGMLMQREAERESEGIEYVADQRPPHW